MGQVPICQVPGEQQSQQRSDAIVVQDLPPRLGQTQHSAWGPGPEKKKSGNHQIEETSYAAREKIGAKKGKVS